MSRASYLRDGNGRADLQIHTAMGDGLADLPELLAYVEEHTDLSVIAITDHDDIRAAWEARELWAKDSYSFEVIVGEEITTLEGHLVALFIEEPIPSLRPLRESLQAVHAQGGLCIIPHPLAWMTRSIQQRTIDEIMRLAVDGAYFDAIEVENQTLAARITRGRALRLNREAYHLAEVGGSDAHFLQAIGTAYTSFPGYTADDLRQAILSKTTAAATNGRHPTWRELGVRQIMRQQWRGFTVTPRTLGWAPVARSFMRRWWM